MMRRLFTLASAISLLFCAALVAFWLSGYVLGWDGVWEHIDSDHLGHSQREIEIVGGGICLSEFGMRVAPNETELAQLYRTWQLGPPERYWKRKLDNDYPSRWQSSPSRWVFLSQITLERPYMVTRRVAILPCWSLAIAGLILPVLWIATRRKKATPDRNSPGH
jgi:hypothetical protein